MSHSRRKAPFASVTTATSDQPDKRLAGRRWRRVNRVILAVTGDDTALRNRRLYGDPWSLPKDGKLRFDPLAHPGLMRK